MKSVYTRADGRGKKNYYAVKPKEWGENFELGREGAAFSGAKGAGRTGSNQSSWVEGLPHYPGKGSGTVEAVRGPAKRKK